MPLIDVIKQFIRDSEGSEHLSQSCLDLYSNAEKIAYLNEDGVIFPRQIYPHLEQLMHAELREIHFDSDDSFIRLQQKVINWNPLPTNLKKNDVIKEALRTVLLFVFLDKKQSKCPSFVEEHAKESWQKKKKQLRCQLLEGSDYSFVRSVAQRELFQPYLLQFSDDKSLLDLITMDSRDFEEQLLLLANHYTQYHQARVILQDSIHALDDKDLLKKHSIKIAEKIEQLHQYSSVPLYELTNILKVTNKAIRNPSLANLQICADRGQQLVKVSNHAYILTLNIFLQALIIPEFELTQDEIFDIPVSQAMIQFSHHGDTDVLIAPCLALYHQAEQLALTIEQPNAQGNLSPGQVCPHLEQLFIHQLQEFHFPDEASFIQSRNKIEQWNVTRHESNKSNAIKELLLFVLSCSYIQEHQQQSTLFLDKKQRSMARFLKKVDANLEHKILMIDALNQLDLIIPPITPATLDVALQDIDNPQADSTYRLKEANRLGTILGNSIPQFDRSGHFKIVDQFYKSVKFASEEIKLLKPSEKLYFDAAVFEAESEFTELDHDNPNPQSLHEEFIRCIAKQTHEHLEESIQIDYAHFRALSRQLAKPYVQYHQARLALQEKLNLLPAANEQTTPGERLLELIKELKKCTQHSLYQLTNILKTINTSINTVPSMDKTEIINYYLWQIEGQCALAKHALYQQISSSEVPISEPIRLFKNPLQLDIPKVNVDLANTCGLLVKQPLNYATVIVSWASFFEAKSSIQQSKKQPNCTDRNSEHVEPDSDDPISELASS